MLNQRAVLSLLTTLLTAALVLAACSDDDSSTDTPSDGSAGAVSAEAEPSDDESGDGTAADENTADDPEDEATDDGTPNDGTPNNGNASAAPAWSELATGGARPPERSNPVLVVDEASGVLYLHGGRASGQALDDLWAFDLAAGVWQPLSPAGASPAARFAHTAVWDTARARLVISTGEGEGGVFFSDVWAYDPTADAWERLADNGDGPTDRYGSCAGYDEGGDRFLVSHGFTRSGRFDDTWAFSLATNQWTNVTPDGVVPGERCLHTCAWDPASETLVLFGGQDNRAAQLNDTWVLGASGWQEQTAEAGPSARRFTDAVARAGEVHLFGGIGADGRTADLWRYGTNGDGWSPSPTQDAPTARHSHAAALGSASDGGDRIYLFGGNTADGERNDLWVITLPA